MTTNQNEYKLANGQVISIQKNNKIWEVACWNADDTHHWYKEFDSEDLAYQEFKRWRK